MQKDFHYYATYCAATLAGYSPQESADICYCDQLADLCSVTLLTKLHAPRSAATTQLAFEMANAPTDILGLQDITRIWSSFHFLPYDLYADPGKGGKRYHNKYRLICKPNGALLRDTVELARGKGLQATGLAMHILADTWAHQNFAGTPSLVINNTNDYFYEIVDGPDGPLRRPIKIRHNPAAKDDLDQGIYTNSVYQPTENAVMNLGHGRAGHLPDYSFARYAYLPAWADYDEVVKDNPSDYWHAFCQMVYAMRCLREGEPFKTHQYDWETPGAWKDEIWSILTKRQLDACDDWEELGERMAGERLRPFDLDAYQQEYLDAPNDAKDDTFLGRFILAALAQKSMVTNRIFKSGNLLAGISIDFNKQGLAGIKDFFKLARQASEEVGE